MYTFEKMHPVRPILTWTQSVEGAWHDCGAALPSGQEHVSVQAVRESREDGLWGVTGPPCGVQVPILCIKLVHHWGQRVAVVEVHHFAAGAVAERLLQRQSKWEPSKKAVLG